MPPTPHRRSRPHGFTIIELLVVIGIIAVLAAMLLPAIAAVRKAARVGSTEALLTRVETATNHFRADAGFYPIDYIPKDTAPVTLVRLPDYPTPSGNAFPPEALCYILANANLGDMPYVAQGFPKAARQAPYLRLARDKERLDLDDDGLPEIVDAWGRPFLYNRPPFPNGHFFDNCDYAQPSGNDGKPYHNTQSFDLYSVGPDGQTGPPEGETGHDPLPDPIQNLDGFCANAMDQDSDGDQDDDIRNWERD